MEKVFCECGSALHVSGPDSDRVYTYWNRLHQGAGHKERVTAQEAERIRDQLKISENAAFREAVRKKKKEVTAMRKLEWRNEQKEAKRQQRAKERKG